MAKKLKIDERKFGESMAENRNLDELNMLQNDGKIELVEQKREDRKDVDAVIAGRKTVEDVPQAVTIELLKEHANQNKIFSKLESHCEQDGVDIYAYFLKCFKDNETVRLSDILEDISKKIPTLINVINDDKNNNLFIDGNGNIDIEGSIRKAKQNNRQLSSYVQAIADDSGKNTETIKEDKKLEPERMIEIQKYKDDFIKKWDDMVKNPNIDSIKNDVENIRSGRKTEGSNLTQEEYEIFSFAESISDYVRNSNISTVNSEIEVAKELYSRLRYLREIDLSKIGNPEIVKYVRSAMELTEKHVARLLKLNEKQLEDADLAKKFGLTDEQFKDYIQERFSEYNKDREERRKEFDTAKKYDIAESISETKKVFYENSDGLVLLKALKLIIKNEKTDYVYKESDKVPYDDLILKSIRSENPELWKKSEETLEKDDSVDVFLEVLKARFFENEFDNPNVNYDSMKNKENLTPEEYKQAVKGTECIYVLRAIHFAMKYPNTDYPKDVELNKKAKEVLRKNLPEAFDASNQLTPKSVSDAVRKKYGHLKMLRNVEMTEEGILNECEKRTLSFLKSGIRLEILGEDSKLNGVSMSDTIKSKEFINEVNKKTENKRNYIVDTRLKQHIQNRFVEANNNVSNNITNNAQLYDLIRNAVLIVTSTNFNSQNYADDIQKEAEKVIAKYMPSSIVNGQVDYEKLKLDFLELRKNNPNIASPLKDEDPIRNEMNYLRNIIREDYNRSEFQRNKNILAEKYGRESKECNKEHRTNNRIKEDQNVLNFIKVVKASRKNKTYTDNNLDEGLEKLTSRVEARIHNKIEDENEYQEAIRETDIKEFDEDLYMNMAKEAKLTLIRRDAIDLVAQTLNSRQNVNNDALRQAFDYFIGTKRDLDKSPIYNNEDSMRVKRLKLIVKKFAPEACVNGEIKDEELMAKYNELFGTDYKTSDEMYETIEDKVLGKYVGKVVEGLENNVGYNNEYANLLANGKFYVKSLAKNEKFEKVHYNIDLTLDLIEEFQQGIDSRLDGTISRENEIEHIKNTMALLGTLRGRVKDANKINDMFKMYGQITDQVYEIVKKEIDYYFPGNKKSNGDIDVEALEESYTKFIEENGIEIKNSDLASGLNIHKTSYNKKKELEGRKKDTGYRSAEELNARPRMAEMQDKINKLGQVLRYDESARPISVIEAKKIFEEKAEEIVVDASVIKQKDEKNEEQIRMGRTTTIGEDEILHVFEANAVEIGGQEDKKVQQAETRKVEQHQGDINNGIHVEQVEVGKNLPDIPKTKGFFASIIDKVKNAVSDRIKNIKETFFGGSNSNSTGTTDTNTAATSSSGGVNKEEQNVEALTGHGKIQLTFGAPTNQVQGDETKVKDDATNLRNDGEEK